jgi:hypothetical protein
METLGNAILRNSAAKFYCKCCDYGTSRKSSYDDHMLSAKHQKGTLGNVLETNGYQTSSKFCASKYFCKQCEKNFKGRSGLWKHKQICSSKEDIGREFEDEIDNSDELKELMKYLMKENFEMKTMMMEQSNIMMEVIKNGATQNSHNTTTNSHNKAFNLNFFLNETCKDAMNITDFVESIKLQLSDLERVGELGYVEGISNIIVKNLKGLDVTQRPVHCTDKKRETMYIKDDDKWEKDEEQKKMHKMVRKVADKNARMLPKFKEAHPDCIKSASVYSDQYNQIIMEAMGGKGDNDFGEEEKIIKKVSKEVMVEKESP